MIVSEENSKILYQVLCNFCPVPKSEWEAWSPAIQELSVTKNEILVKVGDAPKNLYFIAFGLFRIYYTTETGNEKTLVFRSKMNFIAAYSSFLKGSTADYTIQALEKSTLLFIPFDKYSQQLLEHPCWNVIRQKYEQSLFIEQEEREKQFLINDAEKRYEFFRKRYPGLIYHIPQYQIASYLGITPETLSRIRTQKN